MRPVEAASVPELANIHVFAFGGVGFAGATSNGETEYRKIQAGTRAQSHFEELFQSGSLEAKCYALVGLQKLSPRKFRELSAPWRTATAQVTTMRGCVIGHEPIALIIKSIEAGGYSNL
jgi:hypothetical protein